MDSRPRPPLRERLNRRTISRAHRRVVRATSLSPAYGIWGNGWDWERHHHVALRRLEGRVERLRELFGHTAALTLCSSYWRRKFAPSRTLKVGGVALVLAAIPFGGGHLIALLGLATFALGGAWADKALFRADRRYPHADFLLRFPYWKLLRTLRRNQDDIPLRALLDPETRSLMLIFFDLNGPSAEVAVKLADEFSGTITELVETARLLER